MDSTICSIQRPSFQRKPRRASQRIPFGIGTLVIDPANIPPHIRAAMERAPAIRAGSVPLSRALPPVAGLGPGKAAEPTPAQERWQQGEEKALSALVVTELRRRGCFVIVSRTDKPQHCQRGLPDLIVCRGSKVAMVELKAGNGRLTQAQAECHAELEAAGVPVTTAWSFDHAVQFAVSRLFS
jgi:hypothetical protein